MRWQLAGDWPVGPTLIAGGTVVDGVTDRDGFAVAAHWNGIELPLPMPINAIALDEDAALQMCLWYDEEASIGGWHHLHFAPGIDREAILAQARVAKRWPNGMPQTIRGPSPSKRRSAAKGS
jgi:hypothetical protein